MMQRALLLAGYVLAGIVSLVWLTLSHAGAAPQFPALTGRVVDEAGILSDDTKQKLTAMLAGDEQQSGRQVVVVTLKSLQGYTIEEFGVDLGRAWGLGQKGKDNGALLIIAPAEHKVRIEVGYGLEGTLTDAQSRVIIDEYMRPSFRKNDYDAGILAGTKAVLQTLGNKTLAPPPESQDDDNSNGVPFGFIIFIILMLVLFHGGRMFWPLLFMGGFGGGRGGWGGGGFGGGGFGGGSGGGGFSGGGGSFGGGGASGSW
jgi:uncharacterized protein